MTVDINTLTNALQSAFPDFGKSKAEKTAQYILDFFGFDDYCIDNILTTDDRETFYMLEDKKILRTKAEEARIAKGKIWRIHRWYLEKDKITEYSEKYEAEADGLLAAKAPLSFYENLSPKVWERTEV